ncbi:uncharacterized protein LOC131302450 [Rhododendron vialii]|uniref:uncharacterized protein LOC131302450 n=3 Tax=Rhododendron vialii TaxID=182163 RepID=UPI00265E742F|nr:uncharacterized protein LOC131302450 [Rhododendron vialii]
MKNELEEMQKERDAMKEKLQKIVTMSNTMLQAQEQHKFLIEKTAVLEKDSDTMKNQLLEMEKERDSLEQKLQKMDTISNVLKKDRDEMEKQLLEMGKERDEFEKQKHMMLEQFEIEKNKIKKALTMQVESLMTEKGQLQKYLSTTEQRQKAIIVQKDAEIRSLTNKLSLTSKLSIQPQHTKEPQKHLPVLETDSSLLTQRSEEAIHNITQTYTDQKIEQVVHEVTQLYAHAGKDSEEDNKDDNAKQRPRRQKMDDKYYYGSITKDGRKKEQIVLVESDKPQAEIKKLDDKIPPLGKKADIVLALLPDECQETIRKFWELEEGCMHIWDCELDDLRIYQEDVRFLLCDRELTGQPIDAYVHLLTTTLQPPTSGPSFSLGIEDSQQDMPFVFNSFSSTFLGGDQNSANRALDVVRSKILNTRTILIPIYGSSHYTLLELDTIDQEWRFYNSIHRQGRRDKYCEATANLRKNVTNYINQQCKKKIKTSAKLVDNAPQQEPGSVDCAVVVAYIIRQKLMKKPIKSDLTKQQCLQMRADIVQAFVSDPKRSWTPEIYHNRMENLRLQKYYDDQELLEEKKKKA